MFGCQPELDGVYIFTVRELGRVPRRYGQFVGGQKAKGVYDYGMSLCEYFYLLTLVVYSLELDGSRRLSLLVLIHVIRSRSAGRVRGCGGGCGWLDYSV